MGYFKGKIGFLFILLPLFAWAEEQPIANYPDWKVKEIEDHDQYKVGASFYTLIPPDGRKPIIIDSVMVLRIETGSVHPEKVYKSRKVRKTNSHYAGSGDPTKSDTQSGAGSTEVTEFGIVASERSSSGVGASTNGPNGTAGVSSSMNPSDGAYGSSGSSTGSSNIAGGTSQAGNGGNSNSSKFQVAPGSFSVSKGNASSSASSGYTGGFGGNGTYTGGAGSSTTGVVSGSAYRAPSSATARGSGHDYITGVNDGAVQSAAGIGSRAGKYINRVNK